MKKCLFPLDAYGVSCPTGSKNLERKEVTLLTAIVYKQVQGHIVVLDSLMSVYLLANTNLIFIWGQTSSYLVFWGVFENIHYVRPVLHSEPEWNIRNKNCLA